MSWSLDTVSWFQSVILWLAIVPCGWEKLDTGFLGSVPYQCSPCMYEELLVLRLEAIHPNSFGQIVSLKFMLPVPYSRHRYCSIWSSIPFGISSVRPNLEKRPPRIWSSDCNKASKRFEVTCLQMTLIMYYLFLWRNANLSVLQNKLHLYKVIINEYSFTFFLKRLWTCVVTSKKYVQMYPQRTHPGLH